jgi:hypothetical protein
MPITDTLYISPCLYFSSDYTCYLEAANLSSSNPQQNYIPQMTACPRLLAFYDSYMYRTSTLYCNSDWLSHGWRQHAPPKRQQHGPHPHGAKTQQQNQNQQTEQVGATVRFWTFFFQEILRSNLDRISWLRFCWVFLSLSRHSLGQYLDQATTASFRTLFNSLLNNHPTIRRYRVQTLIVL